MRVHILQHVPFEDTGSIALWLENSKADVNYTRFFHDPALPRPDGLDLIIIMGGPMSVNDELALPWLRAEKEFIRHAVRSGTAVLGICLGAQLIASALGARVYPNHQKEIGWFPVEYVTAKEGAFVFPARFEAFHWHGETFDLPEGAIRLAQSEACKNQAFQIGKNIIGLQFHLEATPESISLLLDNCGNELSEARYIQTGPEMRRTGKTACSTVNRIMDDLLSYMLKEGRYAK